MTSHIQKQSYYYEEYPHPFIITNMKTIIKILGPGCSKCSTTYLNALEAVKQSGLDAEVQKIEDLEEMFKYNVLTTPVLIINEVVKVKGRVAEINEIKQFFNT